MNRQPTVILTALCWCISFLTPAIAAPSGAMLPLFVPAAEASAARQVLGHDFLSYRRTQGPRRGRDSVYLSGSNSSVLLDRETGLAVEVYNDTKTSGGSGPPLIAPDQAFVHVTEFFKTTGIVLDGVWTLTHHDYYAGSRQYDFTWRRVFRGVALASLINVTMDADGGHVLHYMLIDDPVVIPLQVNLTGEEALTIIAREKGWAHPVIKAADLQVWYPDGYPGPQALLWRFEIMNPDATTGSDSYLWADVNATTGKITRLDSPAGFFRRMLKGQKTLSVPLPKPDLKALRGAKLPPTVFQLAKLKKPK